MSSAQNQERRPGGAPPHPSEPARGSTDPTSSRAALGWLCALALLASSVGCASKPAGPTPAEVAQSTPKAELRSAIESDQARLMELISSPGETFEISFTQSPELHEIAQRLPAFQRALRERESEPGDKARR